MKERMLEINPNVDVRIHNCFFLPENADEFPFDEYDYIIDAVDTVTALSLIHIFLSNRYELIRIYDCSIK